MPGKREFKEERILVTVKDLGDEFSCEVESSLQGVSPDELVTTSATLCYAGLYAAIKVYLGMTKVAPEVTHDLFVKTAKNIEQLRLIDVDVFDGLPDYVRKQFIEIIEACVDDKGSE